MTNEQWKAIAATTLAQIRERYVTLGFSPDRIKTLMMQAELNIAEFRSALR